VAPAKLPPDCLQVPSLWWGLVSGTNSEAMSWHPQTPARETNSEAMSWHRRPIQRPRRGTGDQFRGHVVALTNSRQTAFRYPVYGGAWFRGVLLVSFSKQFEKEVRTKACVSETESFSERLSVKPKSVWKKIHNKHAFAKPNDTLGEPRIKELTTKSDMTISAVGSNNTYRPKRSSSEALLPW